MRGFLAIFEREIFERRLLGLVALALGLVAVALPRVPGFLPGGMSAEDLQNGLALGFALLLTGLLALFLGGSVIAGDLAERRLGFYFARPLAGWAIWAGKIAAALALIFGGGLLVLAPAALISGGINLNAELGLPMLMSGGGLALSWTLVLLLVLFAAHAVNVIVRARSPWALLDVAALGVVSLLVWAAARRMTVAGIPVRMLDRDAELSILGWMESGFFGLLFFILVAAGAFQVIRGRTDLRRGHQLLSASLWGTLLAAALAFGAVSLWVMAAGPGDLQGFEGISASPRGRWIAFHGPAVRRPGYEPSFLYDVASGRAVPARFGRLSAFGEEAAPRFSADGRRVVWMEYDGVPGQSAVAVFRLDLDQPGAVPVRTPVSFREVPYGFTLSLDGRRIAAYERMPGDRLTVDEIDTGRLLVSARYDSPTAHPRLAFAGADRLRIYEMTSYRYLWKGGRIFFSSAEGSDILELSLATAAAKVEPTGRIPGRTAFFEWILSPDGSRAVERTRNLLQLCDARTGQPLAELADGHARAAFLADGRIAVTRVAPQVELRIFSPDGRPDPRRFGFGGVRNLSIVDQPAPGLVRVAGLRRGDPRPSWQIWTVDLGTGAVQPQGLRRLAELKLPVLARRPVSFAGKDGVVWNDYGNSQQRIVLKGP